MYNEHNDEELKDTRWKLETTCRIEKQKKSERERNHCEPTWIEVKLLFSLGGNFMTRWIDPQNEW